MLFRQIQYYVAVVETGSFTEAAEQCYISQSAISQQIQALERELGVKLLERGNRKFTLTPAGEHLYQRGKRWLADAERMREETVRLSRADHPTMNVGYLSAYSGREFAAAVAQFAFRHPEVDVHVTRGTHEELYDLLRFGQLDLVLSDPRRAFNSSYYNEPVFEGYCCAEISARHPLAEGDRVTLEQLKDTDCILVSSRGQRQNEQTYYQNTLDFGSRFLFADTIEEARMLVISGKGFMPVLEAVVEPPQPEMMLKRLPIFGPDGRISRSYYAFWKKRRGDTSMHAEFAALLQEKFRAAKSGSVPGTITE